MKDFFITLLIGMLFIYGAYMPFETTLGIILKLFLYFCGYALIRYYGRNYWKWNDN